ncbi:MAG: hypothetical protein KDD11_15415, partial [Acidobacteria bacterium]|nr:hypothetical protein [Acidobacteriota bacterium]
MSAWVGARWIASSGRLGLLGLCLLMVSSQGCGGGGPESASIGTSEATNGRTIRPVPAPPLETMEAAVRTQLETRRREV